MRWNDLRQSTNIVDRRGLGGGLALGGGGIATVVLAIAIYLCGGDPSALFQGGLPGQQGAEPAASRGAGPSDENRQFVGAVVGSLEDTWRQILPQQARMRLVEPKLVLFTGQTSSACGHASSAVGPFYCPGDQAMYLDFAFFDELKRQFRAPGDFAQAYVIAHEFGHHIQNLTGAMQKVQRAANDNRLQVALELQADCYAGVWAHYFAKQGRLDAGDAEEALKAASAVGDDNIQKRTQGYVVPESFTHGSAQQRMAYFSKGFQTGDMRQCETFR
jgi:uncharacterized protein